MNNKQNRTTWLRATWFIAWTVLIALGLTFVTYDTAAADTIPCAAPAWVTEGSHIPQDAVDAICAPVPAASLKYPVIHWEVHQKATGTTEYRGP